MRGLEYPHQLEITVDGARVHLASFGGDEDFKASLKNPDAGGRRCGRAVRGRECRLNAGPHTIGVAFIEKTAAQNTLAAAAVPSQLARHVRLHRLSAHRRVLVTGPFNATGVWRHAEPSPDLHVPSGDAPRRKSRARARIVSTLARLAYRGAGQRRRHSAADVVLRDAAAATGNFERRHPARAAAHAREPKFVLRVERDPANAAPGAVYPLNDLDLASRLSFFLWSSIPDDELLRVAEQGKSARRRLVLRQQVRRMLADPKSEALVANFAGQWLLPAQPEEHGAELSTEFPDFDDNLRQRVRAARPSCSSRASCARTAACST